MAWRCSPVCVGACLGALLAAACGGGVSNRLTAGDGQPTAAGRAGQVRSDRTDLRSPDVDGRMDPVSQGTVFVCPSAGRVEVSFDPGGTVALIASTGPLVYGAVATRAVNRACRSLGGLHRVPTGALQERRSAATLTCILPRSARFDVHPIMVAGRELGTTVAVLDGGVRRVLLLAVLEPRASRIFYAGACRTAAPGR
jgi:hypothetical protein